MAGRRTREISGLACGLIIGAVVFVSIVPASAQVDDGSLNLANYARKDQPNVFTSTATWDDVVGAAIRTDDEYGREFWIEPGGSMSWDDAEDGVRLWHESGVLSIDNSFRINRLLEGSMLQPGEITQDFTLNTSHGNVQTITLGGNVSLTDIIRLPGGGQALTLTLFIVQDELGSRGLTWPSTVNWPSDIPPILSITPGAVDEVRLTMPDMQSAEAEWFGSIIGQNYSP